MSTTNLLGGNPPDHTSGVTFLPTTTGLGAPPSTTSSSPLFVGPTPTGSGNWPKDAGPGPSVYYYVVSDEPTPSVPTDIPAPRRAAHAHHSRRIAHISNISHAEEISHSDTARHRPWRSHSSTNMVGHGADRRPLGSWLQPYSLYSAEEVGADPYSLGRCRIRQATGREGGRWVDRPAADRALCTPGQ